MNIHWPLSFKLPPPLHTTTHFCTFQIHWKNTHGRLLWTTHTQQCEALLADCESEDYPSPLSTHTPQCAVCDSWSPLPGYTVHSPLPGYITESAEATSCPALGPLVPAEVPQTGPSHCWWAGFSSLMLLTHWSFDCFCSDKISHLHRPGVVVIWMLIVAWFKLVLFWCQSIFVHKFFFWYHDGEPPYQKTFGDRC